MSKLLDIDRRGRRRLKGNDAEGFANLQCKIWAHNE